MIMENNQTVVDAKKYLITQKSDIENISQQKINKDLEAITKSELRSKARAGIAIDKEEDEVTRAMSALSLANPFKGV
jgi:hypothetical protein